MRIDLAIVAVGTGVAARKTKTVRKMKTVRGMETLTWMKIVENRMVATTTRTNAKSMIHLRKWVS